MKFILPVVANVREYKAIISFFTGKDTEFWHSHRADQIHLNGFTKQMDQPTAC